MSAPDTDALIAEARQLVAAATPGPWVAEPDTSVGQVLRGSRAWRVAEEIDGLGAGKWTVVKATNGKVIRRVNSTVDQTREREHWVTRAEANVALIAAAPRLLSGLCDALEVLISEMRN